MLCTPNNHKVWITYGSTCSSWIINPNVWITATVDAWKPTVAIMVRVTPYRPPVLLVKCHSQLLVLLLSWKVPTMCPSTALFIEWFQGSNRNIQFGTAQRSTDFLFNIFNIYIYIYSMAAMLLEIPQILPLEIWHWNSTPAVAFKTLDSILVLDM